MLPDLLQNLPRKSLTLPVSGLVNISNLLPVIDHPLFQKLRYRRQLGLLHLTFPGGVHSRFEHSIGVAHLTQRLLSGMAIDAKAARTLVLYALLHDIGHSPFSHQIEPLFSENHRERGARLLGEFDKEVARCGGDPNMLAGLYRGEPDIYQLVEDRNLGTDKLDYLARDAHHLGLDGAPDVARLQAYLVLCDGQVAIEEKLAEEAKRCQLFYSYLYRHVYLNKQSLIVQRMLQRALETWVDETGAPESEVVDATDGAIEERLSSSDHPLVRRIWSRLHERRILRSAVVARIEGYEYLERRAGKQLFVEGITAEAMRGFVEKYNDPRRATALEDRIADRLGLEHGNVAIAARQFFGKLEPKDVLLYSQDRRELAGLFEREPHHKESLVNEYRGLFAVRVSVPQSARARTVEKGREIYELLFE